MKKIIVVVLLALAPAFASADTGGCIAGGLVGGGVGSQMGNGNGRTLLTVIGAMAGCDIGNRLEDGTYGRRGAEVVYVAPAQYSYPSQYEPALCHDARSGGRISCQFLMDNPRYERWGIIESNVQPTSPAPLRPALYNPPQMVSSPANMWERPESRQRAEQRKYVAGPMVDNYLDEPMVEAKCKTGNYGHDGRCLLSFVPALVEEQRACEADGTKCRRYNSGKWAGIYQRLGKDLLARQREEQGNNFNFANN